MSWASRRHTALLVARHVPKRRQLLAPTARQRVSTPGACLAEASDRLGKPATTHERNVTRMLDQLIAWSGALRALRGQ